MQYLFLPRTALLATASLLASTVAVNGQTRQRPNILLFVVDDMGWQDTSVAFGKERTPLNAHFHTPHMERMAQQGMLFTQAYAALVSSPSRVSLMTGMNAARHRVTNWTLEKNKSTDLESPTLAFPEWNVNGITQTAGIPHTYEVTSLAQLLKNSGYHTIHCGKAHWGAIDTPGENPHHMGFEVNIAGHAGGGLASYLGEHNFGNRTDGQPSPLQAIPDLEAYWGKDIFATEALTLEAIKALNKAKRLGQPFLLHMAHYAVHIPFDRDPRFIQRYLDRGLSPNKAAYASLIEGVDKSLGDLMAWLSDNGMSDNTVVIFLSDNGGLSSSAYWRDQPLHVQNAPLNSGKGSAYEGGVRIPMLLRWPGHVQPQSRCDEYLIIEDLFLTLVELAQATAPTKQPIDGVSFRPWLDDMATQTQSMGKAKIRKPSSRKPRSLYWNFPNLWGNEGPGIAPNCTIRQGDWKLIYYYETGRKELFNIPNDIGEHHNLAPQQPDLVRRLSRDLGGYLRSVDAQRPIFKATQLPCPWPDE